MPGTKRKATGAHFAQPDLAWLVAERVAALVSRVKGPLRVLDPAEEMDQLRADSLAALDRYGKDS